MDENSFDRKYNFSYHFYEGLHITGKAIDIDINSYRLTVTGAVSTELSLTFQEVKAMEAVESEVSLNCPDYFTDVGIWKGVPIQALLEKAGVQEGARNVKFISLDETYTQSLSLQRVMRGDVLIAYQFNGSEFHRVHGYPLRIVAPREVGAKWVKWLCQIYVE